MTDPREAARAALASPDAGVRQAALRRLAEAVPQETVESLLREDPSPWVRFEATHALERLGPASVRALTMALADPALWVRRQAARTLSALGEAGALALLSVEHSRCREASEAAGWARGLARARCSVAQLIADLAYEEDARWQAAAAELAHLDRAQVAEVKAALDRPEPLERAAAARALGAIGDPDAVDALEPLIRDGDDHVCRVAAEALGRIGDPRAVPALIAVIDDSSDLVALAVIDALGRIRDRGAVATLARFLLSGHGLLAGPAAQALGLIGGPEARAALAAAADVAQPGQAEAKMALATLVDDQG
ncbi:MAG: HEAT repeat domain-containing protein [Deltaproteobacteria bacterium]|nr:HEAT repeat domain-containing protein [Deltaproteobacteria bacterium]